MKPLLTVDLHEQLISKLNQSTHLSKQKISRILHELENFQCLNIPGYQSYLHDISNKKEVISKLQNSDKTNPRTPNAPKIIPVILAMNWRYAYNNCKKLRRKNTDIKIENRNIHNSIRRKLEKSEYVSSAELVSSLYFLCEYISKCSLKNETQINWLDYQTPELQTWWEENKSAPPRLPMNKIWEIE